MAKYLDGTGLAQLWTKAKETFSASGHTHPYSANSTKLYASDSPYRYGDSSPYYAYFTYNVYSDNRWYLRVYPETPKTVAVDYAYDSDKLDGKHASDFATSGHTHSYLPLSGGTITGPLEISTGALNNTYNEGLRITKANNDWAGITFGSTGLSGAPSGGWFAALNPSGQFIINPDDSGNTAGLTLNKGGNLMWRNNVVIHAGNYTSYCATSGHTHTPASIGALKNYGADTSRPNGTTFTLPSGTNAVSMRSGATSGNDVGIFHLSDDNAFICNSSDNAFLFATFDTDMTADFSTADSAAFAVLSSHTGVKMVGNLTVAGSITSGGTAVSLSGHTHSYAGSDSAGGSANTVKGAYTANGGQQNPNYFGTNRVGFLMMNTTVNSNSQYKDWIIMDCYGGSDVGGGVALGVNRQSLGAYIMRSAAARTSWAESAELIGTHNYTTYCAPASHTHSYLPLSGGTLTGTLNIASGAGISDASGNGMLVYHPSSWTGVASSEWGVGSIDSVGVIRSGAADLKHYRGGTNYVILDSYNVGSYAVSSSVLTAYEPRYGIVSQASSSFTAAVETYYRFDNAVGTITITLPAPSDSYTHSIFFYFTTGSGPAVTFSSTRPIVYYSDFSIAASKTYEINALYNGSKWVMAYSTIG